MRFSSYPAYKPSGVEWLGEVPEGWKVKRLKYLANRIDEKIEADQENRMPYIGLENIASWTGKLLPLDPDFIPDGIANRFKGGETLFGKLRPYLAKACNVDFEGLCSSEILVLRPNHLNRQFLLYCLLSPGFISLVDSSTYGAKMPRAGWDFVGSRTLPVPPDDDQRAIVNFLDRQTAKIDTLIAKRRALIEKLKEKRSALISRTVTRGLPPDAAMAAGLDPYPPLKPSGVEWLGEVPEGWEVLPLKRKFRVVNGGTPASTEEMYWDGDITWVTPDDLGKIETQKIAHSRRQITKDGLDNCSARLVPCSSIIMSTRAPIGHIAIADVEVCTNQGCRSLVPLNESVLSDFIYYSLIGSKAVLQAKGKGTTFMELSSEDLGSHIVTVPSYLEQRAIADFLDRQTAKIDRMVSLEEAVIARMQEYRSALITAAVTGKIDVRGGPRHDRTDRRESL